MTQEQPEFMSFPALPPSVLCHQQELEKFFQLFGIPVHLLSVSQTAVGNVRMEGSVTEKRIVRGDVLDDTVVVWEKFECDCGCRWTQTKNLFGQDFKVDTHDGDECNFSGCEPGHFVHKRGETSDRTEAHDWFRDVRKENPV